MPTLFEQERDRLLRQGVMVRPWGAEWRICYANGTGEQFAEFPEEAIAKGCQMLAEKPPAPAVRRRRKVVRPAWLMTPKRRLRAKIRAHNRKLMRKSSIK